MTTPLDPNSLARAAAREILSTAEKEFSTMDHRPEHEQREYALNTMSAIIDRHFQTMLKDSARLDLLLEALNTEGPDERFSALARMAEKNQSLTREIIDAAMNPTPSTK